MPLLYVAFVDVVSTGTFSVTSVLYFLSLLSALIIRDLSVTSRLMSSLCMPSPPHLQNVFLSIDNRVDERFSSSKLEVPRFVGFTFPNSLREACRRGLH